MRYVQMTEYEIWEFEADTEHYTGSFLWIQYIFFN